MAAIKPQTGLVALFDILGYKQIMLNNDIHKTAQLVSDTLINIPTNIIKNVKTAENMSETDQFETNQTTIDSWQKTLSKINWLIFSDSILISLPFEPQAPPPQILQHYAAFVTVCATLLNKTFSAGLPLRGAISVGEFFIEEKCFAGKPIISAYRTAQELEFSGCILAEDANNLVSQLRKEVIKKGYENMLTMLDQTTILYLVPRKDAPSKRNRTINWVALDLEDFPKIEGNIRDFVTTAFLMHNKIALPVVQAKIINTEMFVRHVLTNLEIKPWSMNSPKIDAAFKSQN
ncbi:MAG: hypothetical protein J7L73_05970 [Anaerolineales bacterium]|nr:hypothetical protein [Anaerolineales bacterium]